ncbi:hypothetical protein KAOT1_13312 [Kordia algicida OT-1]|uniref:Uncharacterized protein n=1 Tax=Kordia algicida OT-1 TaxID=391587 RepID=A9DJW0_9FLAO|nr:hypothetical protein [Kordia algicida]EDP98198.1 hypothetical protein KAOT1_13312 [Kordia algicida OT-1]
MKKKGFKNLSLNKKSVSNLSNMSERLKGGTGSVETCTGWASCGNCTVDCGTNPYESVQLCWHSLNIGPLPCNQNKK